MEAESVIFERNIHNVTRFSSLPLQYLSQLLGQWYLHVIELSRHTDPVCRSRVGFPVRWAVHSRVVHRLLENRAALKTMGRAKRRLQASHYIQRLSNAEKYFCLYCSLYWEYAITLCMDEIVYLHCHQQRMYYSLLCNLFKYFSTSFIASEVSTSYGE